ncbi:helix-turn-helix domain-containing protein [Mycobacterium simiae]|uniref:helix-turn-helix domain-containing protein n=1 Tax=Mycobacterium simiae TaxID=1784 RepID=UPI001E4211D5|nr:helix-turn-helix domain-containing protein [Mycobacterium simiae]
MPDRGADERTDPLWVARVLIEAGVPVFIAKPAKHFDGGWDSSGGHHGCGYWLPKKWQSTEPDLRVLEKYQPGDALGMVCGRKVDGVDTDPRNGGDKSRADLAASGTMPRVYGVAQTPSGGTHELVSTIGVRSLDNVCPGIDLKAGTPEGTGRGFLFIPPTKKLSKLDGAVRQYRWVEPPDLQALAADGPQDRTGEALGRLVDANRRTLNSRTATAHSEAASSTTEVSAFIAEYHRAQRPEILQGWVKAMKVGFREKRSRHSSTVSVVTGALKEARAGYFSAASAIDTLRPLFFDAVTRQPNGQERQRSDGQALDEWNEIVAWAVREARVADLDEVHQRVAEKMPNIPTPGARRVRVERTDAERASALDTAHRVFRDWLGDGYDLDAINAGMAAAAVEGLDGDPLWLLLVSGSGNAKTETVQALHGPGAHVVSTIASQGALLSATSKKERSVDASGGLLRQIGETGLLVIKDVTSILSMGREMRAEVLAALREIYDGHWVRTVGTDGGRTLEWEGRIALVGAVTTAWDTAHAVIAAMGDRFVLLRMDSTKDRVCAGRQAIANTGNEDKMRAELSTAVADVLAGSSPTGIEVSPEETDKLLAAANLVTLARTGVEFDGRGNVVDAHAPEMPTRFAKQLAQVMRGGAAIGMSRSAAMRLAIRCARDSMPPLRLAIIDFLAAHPDSTTTEVRKGVGKPRSTVDRQLQALQMLGAVVCGEEEGMNNKTIWRYSLNDDIDPAALIVPRNVSRPLALDKSPGESDAELGHLLTNLGHPQIEVDHGHQSKSSERNH